MIFRDCNASPGREHGAFHKRRKHSGLKPPFFKIEQNALDEYLEVQLKPGISSITTIHGGDLEFPISHMCMCGFWDCGRKLEYPGKTNPPRGDVLPVETGRSNYVCVTPGPLVMLHILSVQSHRKIKPHEPVVHHSGAKQTLNVTERDTRISP